jgi:hypothetical protein
MPLDSLAILASALICGAEAVVVTHRSLAGSLLGTAVVLLLVAGRYAYLLVASLLVLFVSGGVVLDYYHCTTKGTFLHQQAQRWMAGGVHLFGVWLLHVCILWGVFDVYDEELFFSEEMGHQLASMCYMMLFVITPFLLMPKNYEQGEIQHQWYESVVMMMAATIYCSVFRIAHYVVGLNPPRSMTVPDWDHELIGLFWFFGGLLGVVNALQGKKTAAHIAFPAGFVCFSFISHTDFYPDEFSNSQQWLWTWIVPHKVHAICFGVGE